jgi:hypothetical protein
MWLTGRLAPNFKTIADFRKDNGAAIRATCQQFVALCRKLNLFTPVQGRQFPRQVLLARLDKAPHGAS